ncbi:MAG: gamma carbonic anhydrase family protein [Anaerolineaceae bacterium]|nr:gamma carbonic anhydrase family protein [Anaerolineaceae bacterium]
MGRPERDYDVSWRPELVAPSAFIAPGAVVVGDVTLEAQVSIWFNAVLRGDTAPLRVGAGSNVQDGAVVHADPGFPAIVATGCTIGHNAIVHGAQVGDNALVGMGAILLNGVVVGRDSIVGAGALLTQGKSFPAASLILGNPARVVRSLSPAEIESNRASARAYVAKAAAFRSNLNDSA